MNTWKSYMWTADEDVNMKAIFAVMNTTRAVVKIRPEKKFRPVRDLNPWPLQYRCSALPVELTSQLEAGHYVGSETDPWSDKAGALNGRLMYSDGGTTHGRGVTLCVSRHNLRKNRKKKKIQVQMLGKWRRNGQILIWSLSSSFNKAKERKNLALCLRKDDDMGNKMRSKCFSR